MRGLLWQIGAVPGPGSAAALLAGGCQKPPAPPGFHLISNIRSSEGLALVQNRGEKMKLGGYRD